MPSEFLDRGTFHWQPERLTDQGTELPPDSNVTGSEMALTTTTPLTAKVVARIKQLVDGNAAAAGDVIVSKATQVDRTVTPKLQINFGWKSNSNREPGRQHPANSRALSSRAQLNAEMEADAEAVASDPATASGLASQLRTNPAENFRALSGGFKVCDVGSYHYHEMCLKCSGHGKHNCETYGCFQGQVKCPNCNDGRRQCYSCSGHGTTTVWVKDHNGSEYSRSVSCRECGGGGRVGTCSTCSGYKKINCLTCNGTNKVSCIQCKATGSFLNYFQAWITGALRRTISLDSDSPKGFEQSMSVISPTQIPGLMADTTATKVAHESGYCSITLTCSMPHVHVEATCKQVGITLDAVGRDGFVPLMPRFLDGLLAKPFQDMLQPSASPDIVIASAESSRLTRDLLTKTYAGKKFDAEAMSSTYDRAISGELLNAGHSSIVQAFNTLGASAVRWLWLLGGPVLVVCAAMVALYDVGAWLPWSFQPPGQLNPSAIYAWDAALLLVSLAGFWLTCGLLARRTVRKATHSMAARRPSQGWWPIGFAVAMLTANIGLTQKGVNAATLGLPHGAAWQRISMGWPYPTTTTKPFVHPAPAAIAPERHPIHR